MKKTTLLLLILLVTSTVRGYSQETFGNTLNLGLGVGYYGYVGRSIPVVHANYEFNVVKDFTLAPFISFYSYRNDFYYGNPSKGYRFYAYKETVIPIGVKGSFYFDDLLDAGESWDFYGAGSLGFAIVRASWDNDYDGDRTVYRGASPLFLDIHVGTEYHLTKKIGAFIDLSSGVSTIGIAIH